MSFDVVIYQTIDRTGIPGRRSDSSSMLIRTELSTDGLQLKLTKDIHNVVSINGQRLTIAQKEAIRAIGAHYEVTDLEDNGGDSVLITLRREGHMRVMRIAQSGIRHFADGHGDRVAVSAQDPLNSAPWGDGLTEGV